MDAAGVPCAPINDFAQALADPQVQARRIQVDIAQADGTPFKAIASPLRFSETPIDYPLGPPLLGEHTDEVLREKLALSPDEIESLRTAGAI